MNELLVMVLASERRVRARWRSVSAVVLISPLEMYTEIAKAEKILRIEYVEASEPQSADGR